MASPRLRPGSRRALGWTALVLVAAACGPARVARHGWEPAAGVESLLQVAAAELEGINDLSAEARVILTEPEGRSAATAFITYKRPSRFRVDIRGPLFSHVFTALLDGDSVIVVARGRAWRGTARGGLLAQLLEVDLGAYNLPYAFLGIVEPGHLDSDDPVAYTRADRAAVALRDDGISRRLWVDLSRGFVTREEVYEGGMLAWSRQLQRYRRVGKGDVAVYLPREVQIRQGARAIELSYTACDVNQGISESSFRRGIP
ncbi:MAG: hypothetical protein ABIL09_00445 [Gemmatimonadota bacterium]